jgi:hypothetical protein
MFDWGCGVKFQYEKYLRVTDITIFTPVMNIPDQMAG